ncbi:hypothetical protein [Streptomyces sp. NPDC060184]|uniref:hypothetical protein n=1 Tax=Streptomyces sp. NPDC060184 TaxID=3347064 RepID=UPI00365F151B
MSATDTVRRALLATGRTPGETEHLLAELTAPTTHPMDDQRLDEILDRANAATPGPWCTDSWEIYQGAEYEPGISVWIGETCSAGEMDQDRADAEFVAAARSDVPALVAEVQALRAKVDKLEAAQAGAASAALVDFAERLTAKARSLGGAYLPVDQVCTALRTVAANPTQGSAPSAQPEYRFCGADLGRDESPFTCNRRIAHQGSCSGEMDTEVTS